MGAVVAEGRYPTEYLAGCETALLLFCAAFLGKQDASFCRDLGLLGSCVDVDENRLREMAPHYPANWKFIREDAFSFAKVSYALERHWDVVSLDPFTGDMSQRVVRNLLLWTSIANRVVIVGGNRLDAAMTQAPRGWQRHLPIPRSDLAYWTVLTRVQPQ